MGHAFSSKFIASNLGNGQNSFFAQGLDSWPDDRGDCEGAERNAFASSS